VFKLPLSPYSINVTLKSLARLLLKSVYYKLLVFSSFFFLPIEISLLAGLSWVCAGAAN